LSTVHIQT